MATVTRTVVTCDGTGCTDPAPHRHTLRLDRTKPRTLDLCDRHAEEFLDDVAPWHDAGYVV